MLCSSSQEAVAAEFFALFHVWTVHFQNVLNSVVVGNLNPGNHAVVTSLVNDVWTEFTDKTIQMTLIGTINLDELQVFDGLPNQWRNHGFEDFFDERRWGD